MATLDDNLKTWESYDWSGEGEEWSSGFGNAYHQWHYWIRPRLAEYFEPAMSAIEIGCGRGRWTRFLQAKALTGLDIIQANVDVCAKKYDGLFLLGDGRSFPPPVAKADLIFSFDSLVHAAWPELSGYLSQLRQHLSRRGVAILHHSNMGAYPDQPNPHWRDVTVDYQQVSKFVAEMGLSIDHQELFDWWTPTGVESDCLTFIKNIPATREPSIYHNLDFIAQAGMIKSIWTNTHARH